MKKKLIATLVAGAVMSTGLIGLTACGGSGINKGEQVSAEDWSKAIEATVEAENYTLDSTQEVKTEISGEIMDVAISFSVSGTESGKCYYDATNGKSYSSATAKASVTGDVPEALKESYSNKDYKTEDYYETIEDTIYHAYYSNEDEDAEWDVWETSSISNPLNFVLEEGYATEEDGDYKTLTELYEAFTYSNGVYSAVLYAEDMGFEASVSISIKDGYVIGLAVDYTYEYSTVITMKTHIKMVCNVLNYGTTTVNPSDDAKKAIEEYVNE